MKTSELTGVVLDWAVAKCVEQGFSIRTEPAYLRDFHPSTNWSQGGPIIEREKIDLKFANDGEAEATLWVQLFGVPNSITEYGETPLIAGMRCFVKAKLGDEINLPAELS